MRYFLISCFLTSMIPLAQASEVSPIPLESFSLDEATQEIVDLSFDQLFTKVPIIPYSPCGFTKISDEQIAQSSQYTHDPHWACGDHEEVRKYYDLHEETQLDRNLCCIAANFTGAVIHGDMSQEKLSTHLKQFDVRHLLKNNVQPHSLLSNEAQALIYDSLKDLPRVYDVHMHNMGYDEGNFLNPEIAALRATSCKNYFTFMAIRYAAGMTTVIGSTHEARKRLHQYCGHFPKLYGIILPIHKAVLENGRTDWNATGMYLKNWPGLLTAQTFDNPYKDSEVSPAISVHPFDLQWKEKLIAAHEKGIRLIKWMPPQSIPPDSDALDEYYTTMKNLNMTLIAHSGPEHTMPTNERNQQWYDFGNPLRFRKALQMGVNVILAHCGHKDLIADLDDPNHASKFGHELFIRIAREAHQKNLSGEWTGKVYGDLAAVTTHFGPEFIKEILKVSDEEGIRIIYGSDYPFTNLVQPSQDAYDVCAQAGILDPDKIQSLKEIRSWNPLLANFVFTKNLELTLDNGEKKRFKDQTFTCDFPDAPLNLIHEPEWIKFKSNL